MKTILFNCFLVLFCLGFHLANAQPDLIISDQKVLIQQLDSDNATYSFRIKNAGNATATLTQMKVELKIARYQFDENGKVLYQPFAVLDYVNQRTTSIPPVLSIPAGGFVDIVAPISEPNLFRSRFWLSVELNVNQAVSEPNRTNNTGFGVSYNPRAEVGAADLVIFSRLNIKPINATRTSYSFLLLNDGNLDANLSNMEITTELGIENDPYQVISRDQYMKMRYDSPPNPSRLAIGQATLVKFKLLSGGIRLPTYYRIRVTLNTNRSVVESDETNNSAENNSIGLQ
jgi:hypothetical protein